MRNTLGWTLEGWRAAYQQGQQPDELLPALLASLEPDDPAWICLASDAFLRQALTDLAQRSAALDKPWQQLPLYGVPFAVKDNIDVKGMSTTAACPAYAYQPDQDAAVVAQLIAAGAIVIGKTNLDQFATGLVGTRSPYGAVPNPFDANYVSGGSSSGSAVVVSRGLVPFALGTDTAGSGRVPAGFNNIVGLKPTRGALSARGVVPACRSLDCVTFFTQTLPEAFLLQQLCQQYDPFDPFSRTQPVSRSALPNKPRLGIPAAPEWFGDEQQAAAWQAALTDWRKLPVELVTIDFTPLFALADLLYQGPWVAERYAAVGEFLEAHTDAVNPVVASIVRQGADFSAVDTFNAQYRQRELLNQVDKLLSTVDALLVPTTPVFPTREAVASDPVGVNSWLGRYTNFVNLADLCAIAIPAGFRSDRLPFGMTLIAAAWQEPALLQLASLWQQKHVPVPGLRRIERPLGSLPERIPPGCIPVVVVGAHLTGMPLNTQLTDRGAVLISSTRTAPHYRLFALPSSAPPKPGLLRVQEEGSSILVEVWAMPAAAFGSFVALVPPPLGIGSVELADGTWVKGFICEPWGLQGAQDITALGGWRAFIAQNNDRG